MAEALSLFELPHLGADDPFFRETAGCPAVWHSTNLGREDRCLRTAPHWSHRGLFAEWMPDAN